MQAPLQPCQMHSDSHVKHLFFIEQHLLELLADQRWNADCTLTCSSTWRRWPQPLRLAELCKQSSV